MLGGQKWRRQSSKTTKRDSKIMEDKINYPIFAVPNRGIRRKDDNLYDLHGRSEPHIYKPSLLTESMALLLT
jgi:hypothetical protein